MDKLDKKMKTNNVGRFQMKNIILSKETLRLLDGHELEQAVGGKPKIPVSDTTIGTFDCGYPTVYLCTVTLTCSCSCICDTF